MTKNTSFAVLLCLAFFAVSTCGQVPAATIEQYGALPKSSFIDSIVAAVQEGFNAGQQPKLVSEGVSGTYFLKAANGSTIGVFKPFDEENRAPNNPKNRQNSLGYRTDQRGAVSGEGALKEAAAYFLDQDDGKHFAGVPPTFIVKVMHPYFTLNKTQPDEKIDKNNEFVPVENYTQYTEDGKYVIKYGSIQYFVNGTQDEANFNNTVIDAFPADQLRKIAILDMRILNCDRNTGNILAKKVGESYELIPIDHGYTFPDILSVRVAFINEAERHIQLKKPWTPEELAYIASIDPKKDTEDLAKVFRLRELVLRNFRITDLTLKKCAEGNITLYDITDFMYKKNSMEPASPMAKVVEEALTQTQQESAGHQASQFLAKPSGAVEEKTPSWKDEAFFKNYEKLLDKKIAEMKQNVTAITA